MKKDIPPSKSQALRIWFPYFNFDFGKGMLREQGFGDLNGNASI